MANVATNVYAKFNYDQLCIDKALGNFRQSDNDKRKNNIVVVSGPKKYLFTVVQHQ